MKILKREMKLLGYTSRELAEKLNVSNTAVTMWCKGEFMPKPLHVKKLIDLGFSEDAVIEPSKEV